MRDRGHGSKGPVKPQERHATLKPRAGWAATAMAEYRPGEATIGRPSPWQRRPTLRWRRRPRASEAGAVAAESRPIVAVLGRLRAAAVPGSRSVRPPDAHVEMAAPGSPTVARRAVLPFRAVKAHTDYLVMNVPARRGFVNITPEVERVLRDSGVEEGLVLVNAMHITASVFINDDERGLHADYEAWLERLAPHAPTAQYRHNQTGEDNADAHLKRQVMGREVIVAVTKGKLDFGPWEQIFYGEFDGRRRKRVLVKVIGE